MKYGRKRGGVRGRNSGVMFEGPCCNVITRTPNPEFMPHVSTHLGIEEDPLISLYMLQCCGFVFKPIDP